jgi:hypothetical protein
VAATRLNQVLAVRQGVQTDSHQRLTSLHHDVQKADLLSGIARVYSPIDDDAPRVPGESKNVQRTVESSLAELRKIMVRHWDVNATVESSNCEAYADVVVDGVPLIERAPATFLLFLEKQLKDLRTFIVKLPTLDPAETWTWDEASNAWRTEPSETTRTTKVMRNHVLSPATDKHPAQVTPYQEDQVVGYWKTVKFSGATPARRKAQLLDRVTRLAEAVKYARERANQVEVVDEKPADAVFAWLLAE